MAGPAASAPRATRHPGSIPILGSTVCSSTGLRETCACQRRHECGVAAQGPTERRRSVNNEVQAAPVTGADIIGAVVCATHCWGTTCPSSGHPENVQHRSLRQCTFAVFLLPQSSRRCGEPLQHCDSCSGQLLGSEYGRHEDQACKGDNPSNTRMRARLRAQHHSGGRRQGGQQHVVAEEKVASTRRMALPSRSPLSELDVRISLRRARCGGSLQPSATSSDLLSSAARKQAAACSPDRARGKGRAACGEDRERIGPSCPVSRRGSANRLGEAQPTRVCREEGAVSRRAGNVLGRLPQASLQSAPYSRVMRRGLRFVERWGDRAERVVGTGCRAVAQEEPGTRKSGICGAQGDEPMFRQRLVAAPVQECHEGFTFTESCAGPLQTLVLPQCGSRFFLCIFFGFFWVFFLVFGAWMVENVEQSQGWASRRGCTVLFWVFFLVLPSLVLKTLHHSARPSYDTFTHLSHSRRRSF